MEYLRKNHLDWTDEEAKAQTGEDSAQGHTASSRGILLRGGGTIFTHSEILSVELRKLY